jgi:hypothetical protein
VTRVLWLVKGLGPGGAERLLVEHARARDRDELDYEAAYALDWKQHLVSELESLGVRTHCLGVRNELDPRWTTRLFSLLRRGRYDVVHAHSPTVASVVRLEARALGARRPVIVSTEHNRWPSYRAETRGANRITFGLDDATFAVTADVRDRSPRAAVTTWRCSYTASTSNGCARSLPSAKRRGASSACKRASRWPSRLPTSERARTTRG